MDRKELTEHYFHLRSRKEEVESQLEKIKENLSTIEQQLVQEMENEDLLNFKDDRFGTVFLREECYARIEDPTKVFDWLRSNNMGDIIKETVHAKTLSSLVKESGDIPGVATHYVSKIGIRRTNNKGE